LFCIKENKMGERECAVSQRVNSVRVPAVARVRVYERSWRRARVRGLGRA
jgi:hypothetical protein